MAYHWRPVVLLNFTNQLVAYIVSERLTEMVENAHILSQAQGGFRQNKSTDINRFKLYGITNEDQRLKKLSPSTSILLSDSRKQQREDHIQYRGGTGKCSLSPPILPLYQCIRGRHDAIGAKRREYAKCKS